MSFPINELRIQLENSRLVLNGTQAIMQESYSIIHLPSGAVLSTGIESKRVSNFSALESTNQAIQNAFARDLLYAQEWHESKSALNGFSIFDASLTLERWTFTPENGTWTMTHPVSGEFSNQTIEEIEGKPTLLGRLTRINANVLLPTTWAFAESPNDEELRVWCASVNGAVAYNVYDDSSGQSVLLGQVPNNTPNTLASVPGGTYLVRMAPVASNGTVGILSNIASVAVNSVGATAMMTFETMPVIQEEEKRTFKDVLQKLKFWNKND